MNVHYEKNFSIINRAIRQRITQQLQSYDLNESNFMLVLIICEQPGISQEALNRQIYREHSIITKAVKRLAEHDWVTITADQQDRRKSCLFPTAKAKANYDDLAAIPLAVDHWLATTLSDNEQQALETLLTKLANFVVPPNC